MRPNMTTATIAALAIAISAGASSADTANTVLTLTTPEGVTEFTLEALQDLPTTSFSTTTIWTEGASTFEGVSLHDLFAAYNITSGEVSAVAINDYAVNIPVSVATKDGPIVAYHMDGAEMHRRDKGPLWVVFPYDSKAEYQNETVYSYSIWQLDRMNVE